MKFPLYLPQIENPANNNLSILAADVGGTKTNIAQFVSQNGKMVLQLEETYTTNHHNSLTEIILDFIKKNNFEKPDRISIGAAGPVVNGTCHTTNIKFKIDDVAEIECKKCSNTVKYSFDEIPGFFPPSWFK